MNGLPLGGGVPLGGPAVPIVKMTAYPAADVTVQDGDPTMRGNEHHLRILLPAQGEAIMLPCNQQFLRTLGRQCLKAGGVAQPNYETETE